MQVKISAKGPKIGEPLLQYIEKRVSKLERFLSNIDEAHVELIVTNAKSAEHRQVAQITLRSTTGVILRAEERSPDLRTSFDAALDKMVRQIKRYKGKHWASRVRRAEQEAEALPEAIPAEEESDGHVVRVKTFEVQPMDVEEAIEQMELLGHDFFVFYNTETDGLSVVYKRRTSGYGLLLPQIS